MDIKSLNKKNIILGSISFIYFGLVWILFITNKIFIHKYASIQVGFIFSMVMIPLYCIIPIFLALAIVSVLKLRFFYFLTAYKEKNDAVHSEKFLKRKIREYSNNRLFLRTLTKTEKKAFLFLQIE